MKVTVDLRHVFACLVCVALGFGLHAFAAPPTTTPPPPPPADGAFHAVPPPATGTRWDFKCVGNVSAGVTSNWANEDLDKADGWNGYLQRMTGKGWDPAVFIAPNGIIVSVCFRRPAVEKAPPAPASPIVSGRCTASEVTGMRAQGMSAALIEKVCYGK